MHARIIEQRRSKVSYVRIVWCGETNRCTPRCRCHRATISLASWQTRVSLGSAERASHPRKTRPTNGYLLSVATRADSYEEDRRLFVPASTNCLVISRYTKCAAQYVVYLSLDLFSRPNTSRIICSMKLVVYLYRAMLNACYVIIYRFEIIIVIIIGIIGNSIQLCFSQLCALVFYCVELRSTMWVV